ncbi:MAG: hypothetical protein ACE5D0_06960 [Fidelibacterota bacterium]
MGLWVFSTAQEPLSTISELSLSDLDSTISPTHISALGENKFVILDPESREIILIDKHKIINRIGGFGQGIESFSEPSDMTVQNLKVWISDRAEHFVQQYDYSLNYVGLELIDQTVTDPFYTDILIENPLGKPYIFSKTYGELWSLDEPKWPLIDLNQFESEGTSVLDISSDNYGNLAVLTRSNAVMLFNRFGHRIKVLRIDMKNPANIFNFNHQWLVINKRGMVTRVDGEHLENIHLMQHEVIQDVDTIFEGIAILTNQRILIFK